jgi:hypothetical protein
MSMDTLLMAVTALSLAMAAGMGLLVIKLLRDERRRSDARVAALMEMAAEPPVRGHGERSLTRHKGVPYVATAATKGPPYVETAAYNVLPYVETAATKGPRYVDMAATKGSPNAALHKGVPNGETAATKRPADRDLDLDLRPSPRVNAARGRDLFIAQERNSPWGARAAVIAVLAVAVAGFGTIVLSRGSSAPAQTAVAATPAADAAQPLELLSLRHTRETDSLAVVGLVQNPRSGAPLTRVVATAFAFGPEGALLASGRAPLDFTNLAPGDESPFVVSVPVKGPVTRYRIGFRSESGEVIAHIDKRDASEALARK